METTQNNESDLEFVGEIFINNNTSQSGNQLQRTEEWQEERRGNWTGSQFKNLMTSNPKGMKLPWNSIEKTYMISTGSLKYMYANLMERKTGRYIVSDSTKEMKYGTKIEPLIFRAVNEMLQEKGLYLEAIGYKAFDDIPTAGVSSDAVVKRIIDQVLVGSCEMKACTSWSTLFERTFEKTNETDKDFWQTQGQMLAWNVDENYYCVAEPVQDINKYLYYNGDIMELYTDWLAETKISIEIIKASPIHLQALKRRIKIGESIVQRGLEEGEENLKDIFFEEIEHFKNKNNKDDLGLSEKLDSIFEEIFEEKYPKELEQETELTPQEINEIPVYVEPSFDEIQNDLPF